MSHQSGTIAAGGKDDAGIRDMARCAVTFMVRASL
jgi:hypothetical protein